MQIVGYAIVGGGEADRYLERTCLESFSRLCDTAIVLLNNATQKEKDMIDEYGYLWVEDNREWGKNQHIIKEEFLRNFVAPLEPDATVCLDADEELLVTREKLEEYAKKGQAWYVYIANLWNDGYRSDWSFWNVRFWVWDWKEKLGEGFFKFENRPLHCGLAPKWCYHLNLHAPFLLKHYGLKEKADRMKKVARYEKYDPNQVYRASSYYEALKTDHDEPFDAEKIQKELDKDVESMKQPLNKELAQRKPPKKEYMIVREADGFTFTVTENLLDQQLKQKFKGKGFVLCE